MECQAHDHARAASEATHASNSTVAINEHTRAAGEFANAAKTTTSVEALRTLRLLEQHHQRLSELLKLPLERPAIQDAAENGSQNAQEKEDDNPAVQHLKHEAAAGEKQPQPMKKYPSRELGSSIASNLASARGIRSKYRSLPLSPSVSNTEAPGNVENASRRTGSASKSKMQNMLEHADNPERAPRQNSFEQRSVTASATSPNLQDGHGSLGDEGFSKFYSAFGSIINRISAPLAFAGLPLINEQNDEPAAPVAEPPVVQKRNRPRASASTVTEPDLSTFYSKAALRAISRDGQSANDSFYVVPTSGHTVSYANILTFADKEKRRMGASGHDFRSAGHDMDDDDFVDARESQAPPSPGLRRKTGKSPADKELNNVVEELYLENKSLKEALDQQSKRLHAFELMSQNQGMRLAESMRLMRPGSPAAPPASNPGSGDEMLKKRNRELEEQLSVYTRQMEDLQKDYNKARANLIRYREKWEQLKAGAKARRAGAQGSSEATDEAANSPSLA